MTDICMICMKHESCLINIVENDSNSETILFRLKNCVPEVVNISSLFLRKFLNCAFVGMETMF